MLDLLNKILFDFECSEERFDELDISNALRKLRDKEDKSDPPIEWVAEYLAFNFDECESEERTDRDSYFRSMMSGTTKDGQTVEFPSTSQVTPEMLDYWTSRAIETKHPILKTRYAGLVWEFSNNITGKTANIQMAHFCIDSIIEIAKKRCHKYETSIIEKLRYAIRLSININDQSRTAQLRDAIIEIEDKVAEDGKRGLWGFSYDILVGNKKVNLSDEQELKLIKSLEDRLIRVSNFQNKETFNPFSAESSATRLAQYYRSNNQPEDVRRVLLQYQKAFESISEEASGILAIAWLQKVEAVCREFGLSEEADRILNKIRDRGPDAKKDLKPISVEHEIPQEKMEEFVNAMNEGTYEEASRRIVWHYIPSIGKTAEQLKETAKEYPLQFLFSTSIQDHNGRTIAHIGSLENDFDSHIMRDITQNIQFISAFLRNVLNRFRNKFSLSEDMVASELIQSPVFNPDKIEIIIRGLSAYFNGDHIVAIHLLIPQIEDAIRNLLELNGGTTFKRSRSGGYHLKAFDELLRDKIIINVLGEDVSLYLRLLYTDPRGWNLRNNVCHGISLPQHFCIQITDRVFHTLLLLGQIRERPKE